jgi:hypothetical protein
MCDSKSPVAMKDDECSLLLNYRVLPDGQAEIRNGSQKTHATALNSGAQGYGGIEFRTASGQVQWVVFVGDSMFYSTDKGATWNTGASGLRADYWSLVTMRVASTNYLFCANGGASMYYWNGSAWTTHPTADSGVKYLQVHNDRLWTHATGITIKASALRDPLTFATPSGLSLQVQTHDGDNVITGFFSIGSMLAVFKRNSTAYSTGFGNSDIIVASGSLGLFRDVGCVAFRTITAVGGGGMIWMSERGFEFFRPGMAEPQLISAQIQNFMNGIAWSEIASNPGVPQGVFYTRKLTYECVLPTFGLQNNYTFVYRLPTATAPGAASLLTASPMTGYTLGITAAGYLDLVLTTTDSQAATLGGYLTLSASGAYVGLDADGYLEMEVAASDSAVIFIADRTDEASAPIGVGYDGFVRLLDFGEDEDLDSTGANGSALNARLLGRPLLFDDPFRKKRARTIRILGTSDTAASLTANVYADGLAGTDHTLSMAAASNDQPVQVKARINRRGKTLQPEIRSSEAGLKITAISVAAELLAEVA